MTGDYKELDKEFYRDLLPKISNFVHYQDSSACGSIQVIGDYNGGNVDRENLLFDTKQLEPAFLYLDMMRSYAYVKYKSCDKKNKEELSNERIVTIEKKRNLDMKELQTNYWLNSNSSWMVEYSPEVGASIENDLVIFYEYFNGNQAFFTRFEAITAPEEGAAIQEIEEKLPWHYDDERNYSPPQEHLDERANP